MTSQAAYAKAHYVMKQPRVTMRQTLHCSGPDLENEELHAQSLA